MATKVEKTRFGCIVTGDNGKSVVVEPDLNEVAVVWVFYEIGDGATDEVFRPFAEKDDAIEAAIAHIEMEY